MRALIGFLAAMSCCTIAGCKKDPPVASAAVATASAALDDSPEPPKSVASGLAHMRPGCAVLASLDVQKIALQPELSAVLFSAFDAPPSGAQANSSEELEAFRAFLKQAKLDPKKDITDVAVCLRLDQAAAGSSEPEFVAAVGGRFAQGILKHLHAHAPGKEKVIETKVGTRDALSRDGKLLTQAQDGALLFSSQKGLLAAALEPSKHYLEYSLPTGADIAVVIGSAALGGGPADPSDPVGSLVQRAERVEGRADFARGKVSAAFEFGNEQDANSLVSSLTRLISELTAQAAASPPLVRQMMGPSVQVLSSAQLKAEKTRAELQLSVPPALVAALLQQLAGAAPQGTPPGLTLPGLGGLDAPGPSGLDVSRPKAKP